MREAVRAVFYARCSTEEESQQDALRQQAAEAREWIARKGWQLVDAYVESRSGTTRKGRREYNRLYEDLRRDTFDVIVIKSQDRLMRNTKDWYLFVDRLCTARKRLYIYLEQKFYTADDALITGIKAILAEEYSRELSKKMNNAHRNRQKNGGTPVLTSRTYGYRKLPDQRVAVVEAEARVKRRMYELCAAGYGGRAIAGILTGEGIRNRAGNPFSGADIIRMIRNPLNKGTVVMNRLHYEFDSGRTVKTDPKEQFSYEDKVPAIVSKELWQRANREIDRRAGKFCRIRKGAAEEEKRADTEEIIRKRSEGSYPLSGKLICGICGATYYRTTRKRGKSGERVREWKCRSALLHGKETEKGGCANLTLEEGRLYQLLQDEREMEGEKENNEPAERFQRAIARRREEEERLLNRMMKLTDQMIKRQRERAAETGSREGERRCAEKKMSLLLDKLLEGVISDEEYKKKREELEDCIWKSREGEAKERAEKQSGQIGRAKESSCGKRREQIEAYLHDSMQEILSESLITQSEKLLVYPEKIVMIFKARETAARKEPSAACQERAAESQKIQIQIPCGSTFSYRKRKQQEREQLLEWMRRNPSATVKETAKLLHLSPSGVQYRLRKQREEASHNQDGDGEGK